MTIDTIVIAAAAAIIACAGVVAAFVLVDDCDYWGRDRDEEEKKARG